MDGGLLLLEGLVQIFVRNAELDQFPVELRGLILPLLEGRLRPLEREGPIRRTREGGVNGIR
jgi:hypothetical protein